MDNLEILHLGETIVYNVSDIQCSIDEGGLNLEIETIPLEDGPFSHLSSPTLYIEDATVHANSIHGIENEQIDVQIGWDTDEIQKSDNIFRIYINQHANVRISWISEILTMN